MSQKEVLESVARVRVFVLSGARGGGGWRVTLYHGGKRRERARLGAQARVLVLTSSFHSHTHTRAGGGRTPEATHARLSPPSATMRRQPALAALVVAGAALFLAAAARAAPWDPVLDAAAAAVAAGGAAIESVHADKIVADPEDMSADPKPPPHPLGDKATIAQRIDAALTHEFEDDAAAAAASTGATFSETSKSEDVSQEMIVVLWGSRASSLRPGGRSPKEDTPARARPLSTLFLFSPPTGHRRDGRQGLAQAPHRPGQPGARRRGCRGWGRGGRRRRTAPAPSTPAPAPSTRQARRDRRRRVLVEGCRGWRARPRRRRRPRGRRTCRPGCRR